MDVRAGGRACVVVRTSATELVCQVRLGLDADITAVRTIETLCSPNIIGGRIEFSSDKTSSLRRSDGVQEWPRNAALASR
eukprot:7229346-Pyramimonas_sp.AAC.1